jgi:hypothetical protein
VVALLACGGEQVIGTTSDLGHSQRLICWRRLLAERGRYAPGAPYWTCSTLRQGIHRFVDLALVCPAGVPGTGTREVKDEFDMGVLRGLGRALGGLLAGVFELLRGLLQGVGRLLRRLV